MANYNRVPADERFWKFVTRGDPDECWEWQGGRAGRGYGQFYLGKSQPIGAHRFSWSLHNDLPIPDGQCVLHKCDNPPCVNPSHLWVGSYADNNRDRTAKGRNQGNPTKGRAYMRRYSRATVQALRDEGRTYADIGKVLGISNATAWRTLHRD